METLNEIGICCHSQNHLDLQQLKTLQFFHTPYFSAMSELILKFGAKIFVKCCCCCSVIPWIAKFAFSMIHFYDYPAIKDALKIVLLSVLKITLPRHARRISIIFYPFQ